MKKDNKKALYESIMMAVAKEVKKALNEGEVKMPLAGKLNNIDCCIHPAQRSNTYYAGGFFREMRLVATSYKYTDNYKTLELFGKLIFTPKNKETGEIMETKEYSGKFTITQENLIYKIYPEYYIANQGWCHFTHFSVDNLSINEINNSRLNYPSFWVKKEIIELMKNIRSV